MVAVFLVFSGTFILFSIVAIPKKNKKKSVISKSSITIPKNTNILLVFLYDYPTFPPYLVWQYSSIKTEALLKK